METKILLQILLTVCLTQKTQCDDRVDQIHRVCVESTDGTTCTPISIYREQCFKQFNKCIAVGKKKPPRKGY